MVVISNNIDGEGEQWAWQFDLLGEPKPIENGSTKTFLSIRLVNVPVKHTATLWVAGFSDGSVGATYYTREELIKCEGSDCYAIKEITIEFEEGEGLA